MARFDDYSPYLCYSKPQLPPQVGDRIRIVREGVVTSITPSGFVKFRNDRDGADLVTTVTEPLLEIVERKPYVPEVGDRFTRNGYPEVFALLCKGVSSRRVEYWVVEDRFSSPILMYPCTSNTFEKVIP